MGSIWVIISTYCPYKKAQGYYILESNNEFNRFNETNDGYKTVYYIFMNTIIKMQHRCCHKYLLAQHYILFDN